MHKLSRSAWGAGREGAFARQRPPAAPSVLRGRHRAAAAAAREAEAPPSAAAADLERRLGEAYDRGYEAGYLKGLAEAGASDPPAAAAAVAAGGARKGDSVARSVAKGVVWRLFSTAVTISIAVALLGDALPAGDALKLGGAEFAAKLTMYVVFERLWLLV